MRGGVTGASKDLGHETAYTVEAPSAPNATMVPQGRGMFVSKLVQPGPKTEAQADDTDALAAAAQSARR